jgi:hypothetical protein
MSINISKYSSSDYGSSALNKWSSYTSSSELMKRMQKSGKLLSKETTKSLIPLAPVDTSALDEVGGSGADGQSNDDDRRINEFANAEDDSDKPQKESDEEKDMKKKKASKDGIFPMLFKIVPIGMNIFKKIPKVMSGLGDSMTAISQLIVNSVVTVADLVPSSLAFISLNFALFVIYTICAIMNINNLYKCCIPYACDFICWLFITAFCSFVNILDTIAVKALIGFPLYDIVKYAIDALSAEIHYPDYINELCYTCKLTKNNSLYDALIGYSKQTAVRLGDIVTKDVPPRIVNPAKKGATGIGKMVSIFNI